MQFIIEIKTLIQSARTKAYQAINSAMIEAYWEIGKRIVEEEQNGNQRASYGQEIIKKLSIELTEEFGKGFSERTLREFRQFYNYFPNLEIWRTAFAKLSWSHFQRVLKLSDDNPTLGILLCTETDKTIAKYSVLNQNEQLFASKYLPFLPTEAELIEEIEKERLKFKLINQDDNG